MTALPDSPTVSRRNRGRACSAIVTAIAALCLILSGRPAWAVAQSIAPDVSGALDRDIEATLRRTDVPSASIAIVRDGRIVYVKAYGAARLHPLTPATTETRYAIGSVSKQFTATAILLLAQDGKLALDDPIERYIPGLSAGDRITIRQLLSHTAGYADYSPTDYVTRTQLRATPPTEIVRRWATGPLDFQPGEAWRYCNTCYAIAGLIVEKVSGETLERFLTERIFDELKMQGADVDLHPLGPKDAQGYTRFAFGPVREAQYAGAGWLFATGGLAFRASDLALWDIAMLQRKLLAPQLYEQQLSETKLNTGRGTGYGLGVELRRVDGRNVIQHGGNVSGFYAFNRVYPDDRAAIAVLTNTDFGGAARDAIVDRIAQVLFPLADDVSADRAAYDELRHGAVDRAKLTEDAIGYFTAQVLADYRRSLEPLGEPMRFIRLAKWERGGLTGAVYNVIYPDRVVQFDIFKTSDGRYEQLMIFPPD